jgi:hypothetical protein
VKTLKLASSEESLATLLLELNRSRADAVRVNARPQRQRGGGTVYVAPAMERSVTDVQLDIAQARKLVSLESQIQGTIALNGAFELPDGSLLFPEDRPFVGGQYPPKVLKALSEGNPYASILNKLGKPQVVNKYRVAQLQTYGQSSAAVLKPSAMIAPLVPQGPMSFTDSLVSSVTAITPLIDELQTQRADRKVLRRESQAIEQENARTRRQDDLLFEEKLAALREERQAKQDSRDLEQQARMARLFRDLTN